MLVLQKDIGVDRMKEFSDEDLNKIGWLLLTILAENLKLRVARPDLFEVKWRKNMNNDDEKIDKETGEPLDDNGEPIDEEVVELMQDHDLEKEGAEKVRDLMEETGLDADEAVELADELWYAIDTMQQRFRFN